MSILTFSIIIGTGFLVALGFGALCAKFLGFRLNEQEYYDFKERLKERKK
jgi:predicted membrane-bound spermidine synthase